MVIYDERDGSFFAARDRYGIKPLFWTRQKGQVWIAAEIKAFLGLGWQAEWDVGAIVSGGWGQDTRTVFKGVQKVGLCPPYFQSELGFGDELGRELVLTTAPTRTLPLLSTRWGSRNPPVLGCHLSG